MSVTSVPGFAASGVACGIKSSGAPDLALVATTNRKPVPAAGVFTTNLACAAPVQVSRAHLASGHSAAVILNSGNANAATGEYGRGVAKEMCSLVAAPLGVGTEDVLVCSTGLIGIPMSIDPIAAGIPGLVTNLGTDATAGESAAQAILTTDTMRKESFISSNGFCVGAMAKGAAMLAPAMATMLAVIVTDAVATPDLLKQALAYGVRDSFNMLLVDGAMSTNDTVLLLANGSSNVNTNTKSCATAFMDAIGETCAQLSVAMAADAEGATKLATIVVRGARTESDARQAARSVAASQLVQCSLYGSDPYWGRVLSELGASGATFDPERTNISYNSVTVCRNGVAAAHDEIALAQTMGQREILIECNLQAGDKSATMHFTDLSHAYIDENAATS
ncbi:MAG: bifunctional glutamate N-acetyltransferase/amino-acid acetyltransferase ArgJ [Acidimicrobiia bacterium]|nr:bifunctional glutamate N-acetyltransferase/amino-acid acetyltransferase ArgJ [Acidimicrobiia bacterium]